MRRIVYFHANETHFHRKGYELSLVLKSGGFWNSEVAYCEYKRFFRGI